MNPRTHHASEETERRFPRRFLLAVPGGAAIAGLTEVAVSSRAAAAPGTEPWRLGGNTNVSTSGSNWIGTRNPAPLIVKTTATAGGTPAERMRVQANGRVGIGTNSPGSLLDVDGVARNGGVVRATHTGTGSNAGAFRGIATKAGGFGGWFSGRGGGVWAQGVGSNTQGVFATGTYGVRAVGDEIGVRGSGHTGVHGVGTDADSYGLRGDGDEYGVFGDGFYAVYGTGEIGCRGFGTQYGMFAISADTGIYAEGDPAGFFNGDVNVTGTVLRSAGASRIDHPLDPEHRWLTHAGVESPDRKSVYDGTVVLDRKGEATVALPAYVSKLNTDFRYQLTCIGGHAPVYVAREIRKGRFRIAGGRAGLKVPWQVTGVRRDDYSRAHPLEVETAKSGDERGTRMFVPSGSGARRMPTGKIRRQSA